MWIPLTLLKELQMYQNNTLLGVSEQHSMGQYCYVVSYVL